MFIYFLKEFISWKHVKENQTNSSFLLKSTKKLKSDKTTKMFLCNRSGVYVSNAIKYNEKIGGSRKIGGYCPSEMHLVIDQN